MCIGGVESVLVLILFLAFFLASRLFLRLLIACAQNFVACLVFARRLPPRRSLIHYVQVKT